MGFEGLGFRVWSDSKALKALKECRASRVRLGGGVRDLGFIRETTSFQYPSLKELIVGILKMI